MMCWKELPRSRLCACAASSLYSSHSIALPYRSPDCLGDAPWHQKGRLSKWLLLLSAGYDQPKLSRRIAIINCARVFAKQGLTVRPRLMPSVVADSLAAISVPWTPCSVSAILVMARVISYVNVFHSKVMHGKILHGCLVNPHQARQHVP